MALQVVDTGPGIPADKQELIFKEFERLEGPGSSVRGVGLGLSIVERIGKVLAHPIALQSNALRGSTFSVTVPRAEQRRIAPAEAAAVPVAGSLAGCVALCVDNEPSVLQGMQALLTGWGRSADRGRPRRGGCGRARRRRPPRRHPCRLPLGRRDRVRRHRYLRREAGLAIPAVVITADHSAEVQRETRRSSRGLLRKPPRRRAARDPGAVVQRRAAAAE